MSNPATGIASLDAIGQEVNLTRIEHANIQVKRQDLDRKLGIGRWFQFWVADG